MKSLEKQFIRKIQNVTFALAKVETLDEFARSLADLFVSEFGFHSCWIGLCDYARMEILPIAMSGPAQNCLSLERIRFDDSPLGRGIIGTVVREKRPQIFQNIRENKDCGFVQQEAQTIGIGSLAVFPLMTREKTIGVVLLRSRENDIFRHFERDLLEIFLGEMAVLIGNLRRMSFLEGRMREQTALNLVTQTLNSSLEKDIPVVLDEILQILTKTIPISFGTIHLIQFANDTLVLISQNNIPEAIRNRIKILPKNNGLFWDIVQKRRTAFLNHRKNPNLLMKNWLQELEAGEYAIIPIQFQNTAYGILTVGFDAISNFPESRKNFFEMLGFQIGMGLSNSENFRKASETAQQLRIAREIDTAILTSRNLEEIGVQITESLQKLIPAKQISLVTYNEKRNQFRFVASSQTHSKKETQKNRILFSPEAFEAVFKKKRIFYNTRMNPAIPEENYLYTRGTRSEVIAPLIVQENVIGSVRFASDRVSGFSQSDIQYISEMAKKVSVALSNIQLFEETQQKAKALAERSRNLENLLVLSRQLTSTFEINDIYKHVVKLAKSIFKADAATILQRNESGQFMVRATSGFPRSLVNHFKLNSQHNLSELTFRKKRIIQVYDLQKENRFRVPEIVLQKGYLSAMSAPIAIKGDTLGIMVIHSKKKRRFTREESRMFQNICNELALAVENAKTIFSLQQKMENLKDILEISSKFLVSTDLKKILGELLDIIYDRLRVNGCAISLVSDDEKSLQLMAQKIEKPLFSFGEIDSFYPLKDFVFAQKAVQERRLVYIENISDYPDLAESIRELHKKIGLVSTLDVPMIHSRRVLGILHVNQYKTARKFQSDEIEFIQTLANQAAIAILNAELLYKERKAYQELQKTQEQLIQAEKLSTIGKLSAAIAHEIRNPLGAILNSIGVLRRDVPFEGVHEELIQIVLEETDRIKQIIDEFLIFARPRKPSLQYVNLKKEIRNETAIIKKNGELFKKIHFRISCSDNIFVRVDPHQIREVFENVFMNAAQAMNDGGNISLSVLPSRSLQKVTIIISDTGSGIPQKIIDHVFEPFFSTKNNGTGLGLPIVKRIVEDHSGTIDIKSVSGKGTQVIITLPWEDDQKN
ncbi:MAG: GAF domain-containing protein [Calditrichaeota bacterium]|nr:GAF domain-containing protein [Calditrichota bacterium]